MNQIYLGCHLSVAGGFEKMGRDALKIGADTFAFFTRNPRGGKAKEIVIEDLEALKDILKAHDFGPLVAHAPYTLNPCSKNPDVRDFAFRAMSDDMNRMAMLPGNYYNFHPGSHTGQGSDAGVDMIADLLNKVITPEQETVILLETMAGKGTEVGRNFEEIEEIIKRVKYQDRIGVCLDTCHVHDGGYPIKEDPNAVFEAFNSVIGLEKLKALHVNDSKNPMGAHKDRHEKIGSGYIGLDGIRTILQHPAVKGLPCILETPQDDLAGYGEEIAMLRNSL